MEPRRKEAGSAQVQLGLWDVTSIVIGIIIGVGIFKVPQDIFAIAPGPLAALGVWLLGGVLALFGALCFAELTSTYPRSGGEYVYLTKAFGPLTGFLFAWAQLAVIRPAGIAALAYIFANWAQAFFPLPPMLLAIAAVTILTAINLVGVTLGAATQNLLTIGKLLGLAAIVGVGLFWSPHEALETTPVAVDSSWFARAMIMVLWTYSGWHEAAYIAAEVKNGRRNLPLSLIMGTLGVTLIYLAVNVALLTALGFEKARTTNSVEMFQGLVGRSINLVIMVSALGALNGMIFTTARIYSAFGTDHRLFTSLSHWSRRFRTPVRALLVQGVMTLAYLAFGLVTELCKQIVEGAPLTELPKLLTAEQSLKNLEYWINLTAAVFWSFFLLTGIALFVLRVREPEAVRPFRAPLYPYLPLVFCAWCGYMVYGAVATSPNEALFGFVALLAGLPLYYLPQKKKYLRLGEPVQPMATLSHR